MQVGWEGGGAHARAWAAIRRRAGLRRRAAAHAVGGVISSLRFDGGRESYPVVLAGRDATGAS